MSHDVRKYCSHWRRKVMERRASFYPDWHNKYKRKDGDIFEAAFSGDESTLQKLIEANKELLFTTTQYGQTAVHRACMNGHLGCVQLLVAYRANTSIPDQAGCTPLHYAAGNGYLDLVQYLTEICSSRLDTESNKGYTPIMIAKRSNQQVVAAYLERIASKRSGTLLPW